MRGGSDGISEGECGNESWWSGSGLEVGGAVDGGVEDAADGGGVEEADGGIVDGPGGAGIPP